MSAEQPVTVQLKIDGMTCVHCQETIGGALAETRGVLRADVSYSTGTAVISYDADVVSEDDLEKVVEDLGYRIATEDEEKVRPRQIVFPLLITAVIVGLYALLQGTGILNSLAPDALADSGMGYGMLFVIGLVTSVHCVAMCGGINLSQCIPKSEERVEKGVRAFLPALLYNLGRVISYTLIGLVLGCIGLAAGGGSSVGIPAVVQGILKIVAGVLMIVMGVNMLGIIPVLRKLNPTLPKFLTRKIGKKRAASASPLIVGLLNGIMPCGPLQSMWLVALASGSPLGGALSMFLFSLGTVPLMLGLGSVVAKLGQKFTKTVMTVGSVLVVVLGLAMLTQGGSLTGIVAPTVLATIVLVLIAFGVLFSLRLTNHAVRLTVRVAACGLVIVAGAYLYTRNFAAGTSYDTSVMGEGKQTVTSTLSAGSYPSISVQEGVPVVWIIEADEGSINGCNYKILIPAYDIEYVFHAGENIIEFTPDQKGTFRYSCWMGMIDGTIRVT